MRKWLGTVADIAVAGFTGILAVGIILLLVVVILGIATLPTACLVWLVMFPVDAILNLPHWDFWSIYTVCFIINVIISIFD